jgi:hypothetical protein
MTKNNWYRHESHAGGGKLLLLMLVCFLFIVFVTLGKFGKFGKSFILESNKCIAIPNSDLIDNFCQSKGYKYGWLNSHSCGINEVMCNKKIGDAEYFDCVNMLTVKK